MSETNPSLCQPGKHYFHRYESVIYCSHCGEVKSLAISAEKDKFETARKFFFKHGQFPRNMKDESIASIMKLFQSVTQDKHIVLNDVEWKNQEEYAMFIAIVMVTPEGGYFVDVKTKSSIDLLLQRVQFHLECFTKSPKLGWSGMRFDVKEQRLEVLMKGAKNTNTLLIHPDTTISNQEREEKMGISELYEKHRNVIANENQRDMDAILQLCQNKLKPGEYLELSEKEFPRLAKEPFLFEHFLKNHGYSLAQKDFGYLQTHFIVTRPHSQAK